MAFDKKKRKYMTTEEMHERMDRISGVKQCLTKGCTNTSRHSVFKDGVCQRCQNPKPAVQVSTAELSRLAKLEVAFGEWS